MPGFLDDVAPIGPRERADAAALAMKEAEFYGAIGAAPDDATDGRYTGTRGGDRASPRLGRPV